MYGEFIAKHRILSGFRSQRQLAEKTGISSATISRIEAEVQKPLPETLQVLAKHLHSTSLVELMVVCGYWDADELLEPIDRNISIVKETPSLYVQKPKQVDDEKELSEIAIEDLANHKLTFKGHVLSDDQKMQLAKLLQTAAEMLEKK